MVQDDVKGKVTRDRLRVGIVAGEASGDLLGAHLIRALKEKLPDIEFVGIAGPKMISAGAISLFHMEKLAVNGFTEVIRHYREILGIRRKLTEIFLSDPPNVFIGIDAPDFNLELESQLKAKGIPAIHYVSPSIWAWRGERIRKIAQAVSRILVLFPFEKPIYEKAGIPVTYVGHPLGDMLPMEPNRQLAREQLKLSQSEVIIAMLPGSRQRELHSLAELYVKTAREVIQSCPAARFLVPLVSRETRKIFEKAIYSAGGEDLPITILFGHAYDAITAANVVLVASGTATLETALLKRPMVITYRVSKLTWKLAKRRAYLPYVGLPNVLAGRFIVPELLQENATPENLSQALLNILNDQTLEKELINRFTDMHVALRQNTGEKVAAALLPYLTR
ncbi:lipid-A-disaccharide synthase [Sulfurirhabdus autotrophica]|uniref:Lipid-A-disaccharide synthase n=1 Tax=Sulfurirhabdus autotrophica TaxID=1706046 RepID=A0A4V2W313_9PROT|nr:lipid-A-disaccharide synthase [Sulfurirhabdus autotrophica]TCV90189.1 lipid-A-disaccharide synthase [Sulfurirhabdus autotrophica]